MSTRRGVSLTVAIAIGALTACNYTVGECWRRGERGEGSEGVGAGFGEGSAVGAGAGDFGDAPPGEPQDEPLQCNKTEESPKEGPKSPQDPCPGADDIAGDGATSWSCSDACSSKCPPPGIGPFVSFDRSDFPFITTVEDDGQDDGGGWQVARANLKFTRVVIPRSVNTWYCPLTIGMPLRTQSMGRIDASRAAGISVEITEDVARGMDYKLPQGIFCENFIKMLRQAFPSKYPFLGARVTK